MSKYRMSQIAVMDDNTYCQDFRMNEYEGQGVKLYLTDPKGNTYEYYLGNRKGDLAIVRRTWGGEWEFLHAIAGWGDDIPVKAIHKGKGILQITFEPFMDDKGMNRYHVLRVDLS